MQWLKVKQYFHCSDVELMVFNKIRTGGDHGSHSRQEGCTSDEHGGRRWKDGIPSAARWCQGVHKAKRVVYSTESLLTLE